MPIFIFAIFLSAFLLFQVQPIIARYILPWYGGSPAVWTTCMLCFQLGLLGGYAYAHLLVSKFRDNRKLQIGVHLALMLLSFIFLPITPSDELKPDGTGNPILGIVGLLFSTVGLPYIVISASGPLLQHWFTEVAPGKSPYRLYAVSNLGSLLGLLTYPFLFEPNLGLQQQTWAWSGGYAVYGIFAAVCALLFFKATPPKQQAEQSGDVQGAPSNLDRSLWISFAALGSVLLLSVTNQMTQDIAVVPLLWVLPLGLYLITFIISFDHERWYHRGFWLPLTMISVGAMVWLLNQEYADREIAFEFQVIIYLTAMFSCVMVCHGEMVRLKPAPKYLTSFYLAVSLGGAIGGLLVSLVAPLFFTGYWELHVGLVVFALITLVVVLRGIWPMRKRFMIPAGVWGWLWVIGIGVMIFFLRTHINDQSATLSMRGFYGVLRVNEEKGSDYHYKSLFHGRIAHGKQFYMEEMEGEPATYYGTETGAGLAFSYHPNLEAEPPKPMKVGVIGLGIGTLASFAREGDEVTFFEINSQVEEIARKEFTFLEDCLGTENVILGDARITLENLEPQQYDVLYVDAFSGDSIPIHLLSQQSFELYFRHLKPDGVLAVHISNLHLTLSPPVRTLGEKLGKEVLNIEHDAYDWTEYYSRWVLVTANTEMAEDLRIDNWESEWWDGDDEQVLWTDDYSNLLDVIDWSAKDKLLGGIDWLKEKIFPDDTP